MNLCNQVVVPFICEDIKLMIPYLYDSAGSFGNGKAYVALETGKKTVVFLY